MEKRLEIIIQELLRKGNIPQAEISLRLFLERNPTDPIALNYLGWIASAVDLGQFAIRYFSEAARLAPNWEVPRKNIEKLRERLEANGSRGTEPAEAAVGAAPAQQRNHHERFLLIKAWGSGFWSDVSHVLGQLLVAEMTGRVPVVHWGANSLFRDGTGSNAFELFFNPVSDVGMGDLRREDLDFWPPKWNRQNLAEDEINKWTGAFARIPGFYFLSRPEKVLVSDFYTNVLDLKPWIPADHRLHGLSVDELYRHLVQRYLHPRKEIIGQVEEFYDKHLMTPDFISVHVRGSDKAAEMPDLLEEVNKQYRESIHRLLSTHHCRRIFLMTDDARTLRHYREMYGDMIVTTDCQRTDDSTGVHYQQRPVSERWRLGVEMMVDTYLAAKGRAFVGNGWSNPSLIVKYLKNWPGADYHLLGPENMYHTYNTDLHNW